MTTPPRALTCSTAATSTFTSIPSDTIPLRGVVVCTSTTSGARIVANSLGTSDSRIGR